MKKPIGSQFSFSNLDGARDSISSEDRLQISFERQEAVEDGEEEEMKEEKEEEEEEEKNEKVVQLWSPEKLRRDYITSDPSATRGPSGKVTVHEGHININDAEFDPDPHVPRVKPGVACWGCNVSGADVDWYQHDLHEGIGICMPCMDNTELGRNLLLQLKIELEERQNSQ